NNLLTNAFKFSSAGQKVSCLVSIDDHQGQISIRDRGIGLSPEDLPRLFTRFSRIVTDLNANVEGAGLGLFLSRELAREEGGDITVISTPGQGSEFTLALPLSTASTSAT
ncbi:MAG: sensor histidine kinase, partial [Candidatus Dormibacteraceae bacterium]